MSKKHWRIYHIIMVLAFSFSAPAEAQFLDKLTKGLEKVNKGLDKANQSLDKVLRFDETLKKAKKSEKDNASEKASTSEKASLSENGFFSSQGSQNQTYPTPYLTEETQFLKLEPQEDNFSDVHDGVFAVKRGTAYEFWKVTGEKLFDAEWKYAGEPTFGTDFPVFSDGVVAARRVNPNAAGKTPICLLYLDGRIKELDPSWTTVSQFMDGIALVTKEVNYIEQAFYIDTEGKKLYPNLKVEKGRRNSMRPLRDGMRAYCTLGGDPVGYVWGFIDAQGNVKITPQYSDVTDFANGYAWVSTKKGTKELIDATGKVVYTLDSYYTKTTDVSDNGVFCAVENDRDVYYDLTGKELASYRSCSGFYDGYAFIAQGYEDAEVIDRNFNIIKRMPYNRCNAVDVSYQSPDFKPYGLATVHYGSTVIAPNGDIVLSSSDEDKDSYFQGFRQFSESGYMRGTNCRIKGIQCVTLIKSTGEVAWVFANTNPSNLKSGGSISKKTEPPVVEKLSFTVNVVADPARGGSVSISPTGKIEYGKTATVSASPNKDWAVLFIKTDAEGGTDLELGKEFTVVADQTITVKFAEKGQQDEPDNFGTYQGMANFYDWAVPVYAEINRKGVEKNPYGVDNYGFISLMFDPNKRYVDTKGEGETSANWFAVPFKIVGVQKIETDSAKQWIVVEGGACTAHNIAASSAENPLIGLMANVLMSLDGFTTLNTSPQRYRIEMYDCNPKTGEFMFGKMEAYSVKVGGWVAPNDPSMRESGKGAFLTWTTDGYQPNTFAGAQMKKTPKRNDVLWYPPKSWSNDPSGYQQIIESMKDAYLNSKSDYDQIFDR